MICRDALRSSISMGAFFNGRFLQIRLALSDGPQPGAKCHASESGELVRAGPPRQMARSPVIRDRRLERGIRWVEIATLTILTRESAAGGPLPAGMFRAIRVKGGFGGIYGCSSDMPLVFGTNLLFVPRPKRWCGLSFQHRCVAQVVLKTWFREEEGNSQWLLSGVMKGDTH